MRRVVGVFVVAAACAAVAGAAVPKTITQTTLGGATLGKAKAHYIAHFEGRPYRFDRLENNYERLVFPKPKIEVYFRSNAPAKGAAGIVTWGKAFRTADGVGPCSSLATLESAYGDKLKPYRIAGKIQAYWVGKLLFATHGTTRVTAVTLTSSRISPFVGLNAPDCV